VPLPVAAVNFNYRTEGLGSQSEVYGAMTHMANQNGVFFYGNILRQLNFIIWQHSSARTFPRIESIGLFFSVGVSEV